MDKEDPVIIEETENPEKSEKSEKPEKTEKTEKKKKAGKTDKSDKAEKSEKTGNTPEENGKESGEGTTHPIPIHPGENRRPQLYTRRGGI